jgi:translation initiation factor 2 gamma subunit (eIF-2gamma)
VKILVLGHGRHGKDTAAHFIAGLTGLEFCSSSMFAAQKFITEKLGYESIIECYKKRHQDRNGWYRLICEYNIRDKSRLCRELLEDYDIYVGMRCDKEYESCKHLFDKIFYVDARNRKSVDETMRITYKVEEMIYIDNNGIIEELFNKLKEALQQ